MSKKAKAGDLPVRWLEIDRAPTWPYLNESREAFSRLHGIGDVNIFVGPNNGGKSMLLRSIARQTSFAFGAAQAELDVIRDWTKTSQQLLLSIWRNDPGVESIGRFSKNSFGEVVVPEVISSDSDSLKPLRELANKLEAASAGASLSRTSGGGAPHHSLLEVCARLANELTAYLQKIDAMEVQSLAPTHKIYIPVLRGLRNLGGSNQDIFAQRITTEYFNNERANGAPRIFTGLSLYEDVKRQLLGERDGRRRLRSYEQFLAKHIFDVSDVTLIPRHDHDVLCVKIGDESERAIHDLGDGIQSVVILTYLLLNQERTWFFLEEPELFLHPGLQRKVLNLLLNSGEKHRTFLTTHSNHFLDMSLDYAGVSVYGISKTHVAGSGDEKEPRFLVELLDGADQSALSLLGVRNSSVFLVNATIWVEGLTDRYYLRALLDLYQRSLPDGQWRADEDVHYSFVEYGGGNVVHFAFGERAHDDQRINVERLCARALVIADDDGGSKRRRHEDMRTVLGDRLLVLPVREVENLLPWFVLREVIASYEKCDPSTLTDPDPTSLQQMPLGTLIDDRVLMGSPQRKGGYSAESGTIKAKPDFCERALVHMQDVSLLDHLPAGGKELLEHIYKFIRNQNEDAVASHAGTS